MTLQQMRYFIAVAQNLSFSKAAQQHYVSQTAVSQQIKLLEEELETELFQRTRHSVALTSAGQVFYEYAVRITDLAEDAARRTRAAAAECSTPLEIGMMSGMENLPILEKLLLFKEQHPAIPLHFHLGDFPTLKKRLQQKKLDFALQLELVPLEDTPSPAACSSRPAAPVRSAQPPEPPVQLCVPAPQPACQRTILCTRHGPGAVEPVCASPHPPRQRPAEHQICVFHGGVDASAGFLRRLYHPCRASAGSAARQQKPHLYPAGKRYRSRLGRMEPREHLARPPAASA